MADNLSMALLELFTIPGFHVADKDGKPMEEAWMGEDNHKNCQSKNNDKKIKWLKSTKNQLKLTFSPTP